MKRNSVNHDFGVCRLAPPFWTASAAPASRDLRYGATATPSDSKTKSVIYPFEYDATNFQNLFASFDDSSNSR
jgi:hypothetical protein